MHDAASDPRFVTNAFGAAALLERALSTSLKGWGAADQPLPDY